METLAGYFDHAASSPLRPSARAAMLDVGPVANPASTHRAGQRASALLEESRERVAAAVGAHPTEVIFVSGGTEAINLALKGAWLRERAPVISAAIEHHATLDTLEWLEGMGAGVRFIGCDAESVTDAEEFAAALSPGAIATISVANNETGVLQPVGTISDAATERGAILHLDAVAAVGHVPFHFANSGAQFASIAAHKLGGPVGIGALITARSATVTPLLHGGGQQRGLRSGTGDVAAAVGFAAAITEAIDDLDSETERLMSLTERIRSRVAALPGVRVTGEGLTIPNLVHMVVDRASAESLTFLLDARGFATSNGSACTAGVVQQSHVLTAMGREGAPLRISLGWSTTEDDVDALVEAMPAVIERARHTR